MIRSSIPNRRLISCGTSIDEAEMKQRGCIGIYSDGGLVGAIRGVRDKIKNAVAVDCHPQEEI